LANPDSVRAVLDAVGRRGSQAAGLARRLLDVLGAAAAHSFLLALAEEADKSRRRRLLELLVSFGPAIAGPAREKLSDERWYVVRNMIVILQRVGDRTALPEIRKCANHPDLRVRLEAIKWMLAYDTEVPMDLLDKAIHDPDPKVAEAAVTLAGSYGIKEAVRPLLRLVAGPDLFRRRQPIRLKAIKALGELGQPEALTELAPFFKERLLPVWSLAERRAAYRSLHSYPAAARDPIVERGMRSRDEEIRRICLNLTRAPGGPPPARPS
jgi:HEAT repeat protein